MSSSSCSTSFREFVKNEINFMMLWDYVTPSTSRVWWTWLSQVYTTTPSILVIYMKAWHTPPEWEPMNRIEEMRLWGIYFLITKSPSLSILKCSIEYFIRSKQHIVVQCICGTFIEEMLSQTQFCYYNTEREESRIVCLSNTCDNLNLAANTDWILVL